MRQRNERYAGPRSLGGRALTVGIPVIVLLGIGLWVVLANHGQNQSERSTRKVPASAAPTTPAPNTVSLQGWKLTVPEKNETTGNAAIVDPAALTPPWLTAKQDGSLSFWAPAQGATTQHSDHPRTELDSLTNFSAASSGPRTLKASLAVTQVPEDTQDIILGQIHGAGDISSVPFVMLHYRAGSIVVVVKQKQKGSDSQSYPLFTGIPLNQRFDFAISDLGNGTMTFSATFDGSTRQVNSVMPKAFSDQIVRFQVGCYQQADAAESDGDGGRVTFYQISE